MEGSANKGNNPELWNRLLTQLDDKLQFGLLERLRRATSYHFEGDTLYIEPGSADDEGYLTKGSVFQQLQVFAQAATKVERVKLRKEGS